MYVHVSQRYVWEWFPLAVRTIRLRSAATALRQLLVLRHGNQVAADRLRHMNWASQHVDAYANPPTHSVDCNRPTGLRFSVLSRFLAVINAKHQSQEHRARNAVDFAMTVPEDAPSRSGRHHSREDIDRSLTAVQRTDHLTGENMGGGRAPCCLSTLHPGLQWLHTVLFRSFRNVTSSPECAQPSQSCRMVASSSALALGTSQMITVPRFWIHLIAAQSRSLHRDGPIFRHPKHWTRWYDQPMTASPSGGNASFAAVGVASDSGLVRPDRLPAGRSQVRSLAWAPRDQEHGTLHA